LNGNDTTISVALTTYDGCPFVSPQLESIAAQHRRPDEIVIGDDQSSDATALIVEWFAAGSGIPTHWRSNATRMSSKLGPG
jgi:glycosyltransferase involved in cell wall biosynthesis